MKLKKWLLAAVEPAAAQALSRQLGVGRLVSCVLAARGMERVEQAREFLDLSSHGIHDPFLLPDMAAAVAGVEAAIAAGEPIAVYGDYDVDGVPPPAFRSNICASGAQNAPITSPTVWARATA